jgi:formate-dependent nitrite reductase membrane component NrfD
MTEISAKYEQLVQDLRRDFRPQREWGEGRGLFLVIGHFLVGVAAGAWLFGLIFNYNPGLVAGFVLAGGGGIAHLAFLGRPERFWKMVRHVRTAWISRGFIGLSLFLAGAALYLPPLVLTNWPWAADSMLGYLGWLMAVVGMVVLIVYMGFVYTASKGIPFWNSPLHPILYMTYALRGGIAALLVTMALFEAPSPGAKSLVTVWIAVTAVVIVLFVLEIQGALTSGNAAARRSVHEMFAGRVAVYFYGGTLLIGLVVPLALVSGHIAPLGVGVLAAIGLFSALGDFFMKYTTIRAGIYLPLRPRQQLRHR